MGELMLKFFFKSTPKLSFRHDDSAEHGVSMVNLLEEVDKLPKAADADPQSESV